MDDIKPSTNEQVILKAIATGGDASILDDMKLSTNEEILLAEILKNGGGGLDIVDTLPEGSDINPKKIYELTRDITQGGKVYSKGLYYWDSTDNEWKGITGGSGGKDIILVGLVDKTTAHLPTTRPDGSELIDGDYVKVNTETTVSEDFPFTIDGITFTTMKDTAVRLGGEWIPNASPFQKTAETPLSDPEHESLSGDQNMQDDVNKEFVNYVKNKKAAIKVSSLPTTNIKEDTLYILTVQKNGYMPGTYDYINGAWERIDKGDKLVDSANIDFVDGYTYYDYVETTGEQYFETDFIPADYNHKIEMYLGAAFLEAKDDMLHGTLDATKNVGYFLGCDVDNFCAKFANTTVSGNIQGSHPMVVGTSYTILTNTVGRTDGKFEFATIFPGSWWYIDFSTGYAPNLDESRLGSFILGGCKIISDEGTTYNLHKSRIYRLRIWEEIDGKAVLTHYYRPAKDADGNPGMYDTQTGKFFKAKGTNLEGLVFSTTTYLSEPTALVKTVDELNNNSPIRPLSARQGRILDDKKLNKVTEATEGERIYGKNADGTQAMYGLDDKTLKINEDNNLEALSKPIEEGDGITVEEGEDKVTISAKVDDRTIKINTDGELESINKTIEEGDGINVEEYEDRITISAEVDDKTIIINDDGKLESVDKAVEQGPGIIIGEDEEKITVSAKVDNKTIKINADDELEVTSADNNTKGIVKPDGQTTRINATTGLLEAVAPVPAEFVEGDGIDLIPNPETGEITITTKVDGETITFNEDGKMVAATGSAPDEVTIVVNAEDKLEAVTATADNKGIVKPDGETITINNGEITAVTKVDGETIATNDGGQLYAKASQGIQSSTLPEGYTQLEYIEATGSQYIDTEVSGQITGFEAKVDKTSLAQRQTLFGVYDNLKGLYILYTEQDSKEKMIYVTASGSNTEFITSEPYSLGIKNVSYHYSSGTSTYSVNGNIKSISATPPTITAGVYFYLFASHKGSDGPIYNYNGKLYSCKIWKDGTLARNYVPARRDSDDEVGLYDTVYNVFYENKGTGDFTAGPVYYAAFSFGIVSPDGVSTRINPTTGKLESIASVPDITAGDGIAVEGTKISAKVDNTTIKFNGDGQLTAVGGGGGTADIEAGTGIVIGEEGGGLPTGYKRLEWLGSRTSYVKTGVVPTMNTSAEITVRMPQVPSSGPSNTFGVVDTNRFYAQYSYSGAAWNAYFGTTANTAHLAPCYTDKVNISISAAKVKVYDYDTQLSDETTDPYTGTFTVSKEIWLCGVNGSGSGSRVNTRWYDCKIWESGVLTHHYVPAQRESDGVVSFYDMVEDEFMTVETTAGFEAGPEYAGTKKVNVKIDNETITVDENNTLQTNNIIWRTL